MSPKRGDRAAPPPRQGEYDIRFADNQVAAGWEQLCAQTAGNTRRAWEAITTDPRPKPSSERHHQLKHTLATRAYRGRILEQWQYEVTGGGRIWYLVDDATRTVWLTYAGTGHPKATD
ncbi:MAG: hypothetical protein DLM60_01010 [Pseudonocardiales bacterium]|nr:hypothetical protein [Actinomycetota bacterium]PZS24129.1 MAG: hypothetical protein DLM60_01010 [Pseudonocardiales bacterium]